MYDVYICILYVIIMYMYVHARMHVQLDVDFLQTLRLKTEHSALDYITTC